jgi:Raf kinase inhibitor-like YbhB/YbcL family protein
MNAAVQTLELRPVGSETPSTKLRLSGPEAGGLACLTSLDVARSDAETAISIVHRLTASLEIGQDEWMKLAPVAGLGLVLALAGCGSSSPTAAPTQPATTPPAASTSAPPSTLTVTSPVFTEGGTIPTLYTCTGAGKQPSIAWTGDLKGAAAIAVVVDDPDAPIGTFVHMVVLDLPASATGLGDTLPAGAHYALNGAGRPGWTPPCPPSGTHHYRFTVYGLSAPTGLGDGTSAGDAEAAINAKAVAQGRLTGLVAH